MSRRSPGDSLFDDVLNRYPHIHAGDRAVLREACTLLDLAHDADRHVAADGVLVTGARGNPVVNPALAAAKQLRIAFAQIMRGLKLEYAEDEQQ